MSLLSQPMVATDAVTLRVWPTGETSVVASLLTERAGYLRLIAKGARGERSALRPLVQPGRLVAVECGAAPQRELQYLRGGSVLLDPLLGDNTLERTAYLLAGMELTDRCRPAGDRGARLFALCRDFVQVLSCAARGREAWRFYGFELALLAIHGLAPVVDACVACGASGAGGAAPDWRFSAAAGGAVCGRCGAAGRAPDSRPLEATTLAVLRGLAAGGDGGPGADAGAASEPPRRREVGVLLHLFLGYHLPGYALPAGLDLLRSARRHGRGAAAGAPPSAPPAPRTQPRR